MALRLLTIGLLSAWTMTFFAQSPSQQTRDALQDQSIRSLDQITASNSSDIRQLSIDLASLRSSMERFVGIGIGFGAALTVLQAVQVILQVKGRKGP